MYGRVFVLRLAGQGVDRGWWDVVASPCRLKRWRTRTTRLSCSAAHLDIDLAVEPSRYSRRLLAAMVSWKLTLGDGLADDLGVAPSHRCHPWATLHQRTVAFDAEARKAEIVSGPCRGGEFFIVDTRGILQDVPSGRLVSALSFWVENRSAMVQENRGQDKPQSEEDRWHELSQGEKVACRGSGSRSSGCNQGRS